MKPEEHKLHAAIQEYMQINTKWAANTDERLCNTDDRLARLERRTSRIERNMERLDG